MSTDLAHSTPKRLREPLWLLAYDIANSKRWRRLYRLLCQYGIRIQHSVFLLPISDTEILAIVARVKEIIDEKTDDVRIYHLPVGTRVWHDGPPLADGILIGIADLKRLC